MLLCYSYQRSSGVQSNVTEEKARELCEEAFNNDCPANRISNKPVDESTYLADCIKDVVVSKENKGHIRSILLSKPGPNIIILFHAQLS